MDLTRFNQGLLNFLQASPTPFHAVEQMAAALAAAGFQALDESAVWQLQEGGGYYVIRNGSSLIAFRLGKEPLAGGFSMLGAHTDSPCLKVKPQPEISKQHYFQLGVEIYGGVLLNPWFDRDLSLAGQVSYLDGKGEIQSVLLNMKKPVAVIPSLAIHLDREANTNRSINGQNHLPPVLLQLKAEEKPDFRSLLADYLSREQGVTDVQEVLDYELSLYDVQPPALVGFNEDFISAARLDNLLSCYVGLQALLAQQNTAVSSLLVCSDHEEVGSVSAAGAQGPFLQSVLERVAEKQGGGTESYRRMVDASFLFSMDNAHGIHPNYEDRHDQKHGPRLNAGPVLKVNANQRYAGGSENAALFRKLCRAENVPVQSFVMRSDLACGSTIGPLVAAELGARVLDVGVPTFAMHSIRELAGKQDAYDLYRVMARFLNGG